MIELCSWACGSYSCAFLNGPTLAKRSLISVSWGNKEFSLENSSCWCFLDFDLTGSGFGVRYMNGKFS